MAFNVSKIFGGVFFYIVFLWTLDVNTLPLLPRAKNCILLSSLQVQLNAIVLISNPLFRCILKRQLVIFARNFFLELFWGSQIRSIFLPVKLSKVLKFSSNSWWFYALPYFVMPAKIRRDNLLKKKKKVPRFISSLLFAVQRNNSNWILRVFFPFTFYSTFQNYQQLLYVVIYNSSENLPLRPVKLALFFLTNDYNRGESTYSKLMQAERGHTAVPHPWNSCQLLLTGW